VSAVTLRAPQWNAAANGNPVYCGIDGTMAPVDKNSSAKPVRFRVVLPASWSRRAAQLGGSGMHLRNCSRRTFIATRSLLPTRRV